MPSTTRQQTTKGISTRLWIAQGLLTALFLFAGVMKLVTTADALEAQAHMNGTFLHFIGLCEALGALGLVLPGLFRIRTELTPLAAAGLTIIMTGATVIGLASGQPQMAIVPAVITALCAYVAYGRWQRAPHQRSRRYQQLQPAR